MELLAYIHEEFVYSEQAIATESDITTNSIFESTFLAWLKKLTTKSAKLSLNVILASTTIFIGLGSTLTAVSQTAPSANVKYVQSLLEKNGFNPGAIDGVAGASTKNAIIRAQQSLGLTADGVAGSRTIAALEDGGAGTSINTKAEVKESVVPVSSTVMNLQKLLADRGFYNGVVDGMMGAQTRAAIMAAQKAYNLTPDGVAGSRTLAALETDGNKEAVTPISLPPTSPTKSAEVSNLQELLSKRGFYNGAVDGLMGSQTRLAIVAAQKNYGLVADGVAGSQTLAALETGSTINTADRSSEPIAKATTEVKSDPSVLAAQQLLARRGFYNGAIDGIKGARTRAAIVSAQSFYGLTADGVAGSQTMAALERDVQPSAAPVTVRPTSAPVTVRPTSAPVTVRPTNTQPINQLPANQPVNQPVNPPAKPVTPQPTNTPQQPADAPQPTNAPQPANDGGIANIQNLLTDRGFYKGPITGVVGARTTEAISAAQKSYGLPVDGIVSAQTIAALEAGAPRQQIDAVKNIVMPAINSTVRVETKPQVSPQPTPQSAVTPQAAASPTVTATASPQAAASPTVTATASPQAAASPTTTATPTSQPKPQASPQVQATLPVPPPVQPQTSSNNAQVLELQNLLKKRGFYNGRADGALNGETRNAIVRAQNFYTISPADGSPSNKLIDNLGKDPFISEGN